MRQALSVLREQDLGNLLFNQDIKVGAGQVLGSKVGLCGTGTDVDINGSLHPSLMTSSIMSDKLTTQAVGLTQTNTVAGTDILEVFVRSCSS